MKKVLYTTILSFFISCEIYSQNNFPASGNVGINLGGSSSSNKLQIGPNPQNWNSNDLVVSNSNGGIAVFTTADETYLFGSKSISIRPGFGLYALYAKNNGYIGIGHNAPTSMLHVVQSNNTDWATIISNGGGNGKGLLIKSAAGNITPVLQVEDNSGNNRLMVRSDGYVGIGTANPTSKLQISNGGQTIYLTTGTNTSSYALNVGVNDDGVNFSNNSSSRGFNFSNNTGNLLKITSGGNIGIGTTNPGSTRLAIVHQASQAYHNAFSLSSVNPNIHWPFVITTNNLPNHSGFVNDPDSDIYLLLRDKSGNADVQIHSEGYSFFNGGNVGIGTTSPDAKLAVKGTIHAQEVKVDLNGAVAPDYVFSPNYKLLSLEEIKSYIEKHKHLPEVPSAKEMETNGVNVSEMNMLLLKKIEELTLYVIALKNENNDLKSQISEIDILKSEIESIKKRIH